MATQKFEPATPLLSCQSNASRQPEVRQLPSFQIAWLLNTTFNAVATPGASVILFCSTLPDSTQTICRCSAGSKSGMSCVVHGFQTTVDAELLFSTRIVRRNFASRISTVPGASG